MKESLEELEFIGPDFTWQPIITGNEQIDYLYGYQCAHRYSDWLMRTLKIDLTQNTLNNNAWFRGSVKLRTPAGKGFWDGITGKPNLCDIIGNNTAPRRTGQSDQGH